MAGEAEHKSIRVKILDRDYPLRIAANDEAYTQHLATIVDERLRRLRADIPMQPDLTHAVIGAMEIAGELYSLRADLNRQSAHVDEEINALIAELDSVLGTKK
ncbi:MAG: cell division protein ZapA [Rubricoccaceae bacterium]|nr:cell division protein ZapA [Rubricoccaceae bacterium]